jgi:glycosyltransferase involved in cell wall biosynthesis
MRILYLANIRFPTQMAHGAQIAKACEAFAKLGHEVELVVPKRWTPIIEPWAEYYGVKTVFPVQKLRVPDTVRKWGKFGFIFQTLSFGFAAAFYARRTEADVVYGRDEHILFITLLFGVRPVVWESHDGAWNFFARFVAKHAKKIVVVSEGQKDFYISKGIPAEKIIAVPNGVDTESFAHAEPKSVARERLRIPVDAFVALYVGALGESAALLPAEIHIVIIGGYPKQIAEMKARFPRVLFLGERPYRQLADNLSAADICILPNTAKDPVSVSFTSPLKLLAYMAAGKPIIASDLPSVREIVTEDVALLIPPDDSKKIAEAIERLVGDEPFREELGRKAHAKVQEYDWSKRAERILTHIV